MKPCASMIRAGKPSARTLFRAEFPQPALRMPPPAPLFDLLAERPLVDGERNVDELVFFRCRRGSRPRVFFHDELDRFAPFLPCGVVPISDTD